MKEEYVIVNFASEIPRIWEYCSSNNTEEKIKRFMAEEKECSKRCRNNAEKFPKESDYWSKEADIHEKADFKCITVKEYDKILRNNLLSDEPLKISKEKYDEMYDMFPPLNYIQRNGFDMFCNTEMLISTYTTQYAYDMNNNVYYSKTVDLKDSDTWIDMIILEKRHKFDYQCLSRCVSDCKYFLGNGNRNPKNLWGGQNVEKHINEMKRIYNSLPIKPQWLTMDQIEEFKRLMAKE